MRPYPTALTIAGSDSGGGAGIQADIKTFCDHRVFGMSAVTAVTAQNTVGVRRVDLLPVDALREQIAAVFDDFPVGAVKIGMLGTAAHARCVAEALGALRVRPPIVLDPVMVATSGHRLLDDDAVEVVRAELLPLATVVTPNRPEAAVLGGRDVEGWARRCGVPVLVTGGDTDDTVVRDVLYDGERLRDWSHPKLGTRPFHGTGCTLASSIAARLAHGKSLEHAVEGAIDYVRALLRGSLALGSPGRGSAVLPHGMG